MLNGSWLSAFEYYIQMLTNDYACFSKKIDIMHFIYYCLTDYSSCRLYTCSFYTCRLYTCRLFTCRLFTCRL